MIYPSSGGGPLNSSPIAPIDYPSCLLQGCFLQEMCESKDWNWQDKDQRFPTPPAVAFRMGPSRAAQ